MDAVLRVQQHLNIPHLELAPGLIILTFRAAAKDGAHQPVEVAKGTQKDLLVLTVTIVVILIILVLAIILIVPTKPSAMSLTTSTAFWQSFARWQRPNSMAAVHCD